MIDKISLINPLPRSLPAAARSRSKGVKDVAHANWFGGIYQEPRNFFANMAVDPESWLRMYPEFAVPDDQKKAWLADRTGAIVGVDTAKRFGWKIGDRMPLQVSIYRGPTAARGSLRHGIYESRRKGSTTASSSSTTTTSTKRSGHRLRHDQVGWYVIRVDDPTQSEALAQKLDAMFANSPSETKTSTEKAFVAGFAKQIGDIGQIMV